MKSTMTCGKCGSWAKRVKVSYKEKDRKAYEHFCNSVINRVKEGEACFKPPCRYGTGDLVIPERGKSPCGHCAVGEATVGPGGCTVSGLCLAFMYFMFGEIDIAVGALKESQKPKD